MLSLKWIKIEQIYGMMTRSLLIFIGYHAFTSFSWLYNTRIDPYAALRWGCDGSVGGIGKAGGGDGESCIFRAEHPIPTLVVVYLSLELGARGLQAYHGCVTLWNSVSVLVKAPSSSRCFGILRFLPEFFSRLLMVRLLLRDDWTTLDAYTAFIMFFVLRFHAFLSNLYILLDGPSLLDVLPSRLHASMWYRLLRDALAFVTFALRANMLRVNLYLLTHAPSSNAYTADSSPAADRISGHEYGHGMFVPSPSSVWLPWTFFMLLCVMLQDVMTGSQMLHRVLTPRKYLYRQR